MDAEDKIYGLIIQAQEMQKYALEFKGTAEGVLKSLPDASRNAVRDAAREILIEKAENATKGLLDASERAIATAEELRQAHFWGQVKDILLIVLVAVMICVGVYFWAKHYTTAIAEQKAEIQAMRETVEKLNSQYGKALFSTCSGRPCVRVDERAGRYGETQKGEVYMVLFNY